MKFFKHIKTCRWPFFTIGLMVVLLWGTLLYQNINHSTQPGEIDKQTAYNEVLPNFLAPVIRKEVHKEVKAEKETIAVKISLPRFEILTFW